MIIGLLGFIGSGKNTVANILVEQHGYQVDSYAATLKDVCATVFQWDRALLEGDSQESREFRETNDVWWATKLGLPIFTPRMALQQIGTDLFRDHFHKDIWTLIIERKYSQGAGDVVISDARFSNEIGLVRHLGGKLVRVNKGLNPEWYNCAILANSGDLAARHIMGTKYPRIHVSEWGWVGTEVDHVIENDWTVARLEEKVAKLVTSM